MPRLDYRASLETEVLRYDVRLVLDLLVAEVNSLRAKVKEPVLTAQDLQGKIRAYMREHPRGARPGEER